jgi:hypothetical protein
MSDLVPSNGGGSVGLPADYLQKLQKGIAQSRAVNSVGGAGGGKDLLRMGKDGVWIFGQSNEEYQIGARLVINPVSLMHGWVNWQNGTKRGEIMTPMIGDMPDMPPAINDNDYQNQYSLEVKVLDGEDAGTELLYKTPSYGGKKAVDAVLAAIQAQISEDPGHPCPVVMLESEHYPHQQYGKTYNPIFKIVGWADMNGTIGTPGPQPAAVAPPAAPAAATGKPKKAPLGAAVTPPAALEPAPTAAAHVGQRKRPLK